MVIVIKNHLEELDDELYILYIANAHLGALFLQENDKLEIKSSWLLPRTSSTSYISEFEANFPDSIEFIKTEKGRFLLDEAQQKEKIIETENDVGYVNEIKTDDKFILFRGSNGFAIFDKEEKDYTSIKTYLDLIETAINYNESCRKLRTRFFQYTERYLRENPSVIIV